MAEVSAASGLVPRPFPARVVDVACGPNHALFLTQKSVQAATACVFGLGDNSYGQLGPSGAQHHGTLVPVMCLSGEGRPASMGPEGWGVGSAGMHGLCWRAVSRLMFLATTPPHRESVQHDWGLVLAAQTDRGMTGVFGDWGCVLARQDVA